MPGTDLAYGATRRSEEGFQRVDAAFGGGGQTERARFGGGPQKFGRRSRRVGGRLAATSLRACYAMSGTGIAYRDMHLRACYAMSGTGIAYGTTPCPVLSQHMVLRHVRYWHTIWCYATPSTEIDYAAT
eukprot:2874201-Rhodomonas_salina.3